MQVIRRNVFPLDVTEQIRAAALDKAELLVRIKHRAKRRVIADHSADRRRKAIVFNAVINAVQRGNVVHDGFRVGKLIVHHVQLARRRPDGHPAGLLLAEVIRLHPEKRLRDPRGRLQTVDIGNGQLTDIRDGDRPHAADGIATQREEIVINAESLRVQSERLRKGRAQRAFDRVPRRSVGRLPVGNIRFRQRFQVDLAVGGHGHAFQPHVNLRNHILRQRFGKEGLQRVRINLPVRCVVKHKGIPAHLRRHSHDPLVLTGAVFDFSQLDAEAAQLHLVVDAAQVFQFIVFIVSRQVSGAVHLFAAQPGAGHERLCRQIRTLPVSLRDLGPRQAQFPRHAPGQQTAAIVTDQGPGIGYGAPDGDIQILLLVDGVIAGAYRKFRRSVTVDQLNVCFFAWQHFLAAHHHKPDRHIRKLVD